MSKSRLEKFLYALYSLDSSDLPNPISRIEELYKCWVTGEEVPTFEPLSRVEKYLMAILGAYNVNELPNPLSRVEVLLYKLATGDDNLDDIKSFLSEHEELLAEIIRNGGAGGNINIEYVLYTLSTEHNTLYNTAEKPVKSAILKGQTLVNVHPTDYIVAGSNPTFFLSKIIPETMIKPNTRYFLRLYNTHQSVVSAYFKPCVENRVDFISSDNKCAVFTTKSEFADSDFNNNKIHFYSSSVLTLEDVKDTKVILCEYVDGMENWDIPYFEGMQSVKMPVLTTVGKNLFEPSCIPYNGSEYNDFKKAYATSIQPILRLKPNTTYYIHGEIVQVPKRNTAFKFVDGDGVEIQGTYVSMNNTNGSDYKTIIINNKFTTKTDGNVYFNTFPAYSQEDLDMLKSSFLTSQIQIEEGTTPTTYEPYKSNILTVNEEVELRRIGDVKDELNLLTGELTQRIGAIVVDDTQKGRYRRGDVSPYYVIAVDDIYDGDLVEGTIIADKFRTYTGSRIHSTATYGVASSTDTIKFRIEGCDSEEDYKKYFLSNPVTIRYWLKAESVKTVDLSVVDQDGDNTKLSTFDDIAHVTLSSEGLIPEAEMEVATKNEEVLSTLSLEMDDISTAQTTLEETSNTQSENVDATMIATTEIYEGLL